MGWEPFDHGKSIGSVGTEGGTILIDDEHDLGARITLERDGHIAPFSITCGIYGWTFHTRFFADRAEGERELEEMKAVLSNILTLIPETTDPLCDRKMRDVGEAISRFVERFP